MNTSNASPAYKCETGSVMNTPPLLGTPVGAVRPLPSVELLNVLSHQLGWAMRVSAGSVVTAKSAELVRSRSAIVTSADDVPEVNQAAASDEQVHDATYHL
mmetsp:Transcript_54150/g.160654  ORF Transcript_54150/g.160654 Transcript_54150/m.160654 type:complete len:101 (+) Transcript_54150:653-955(+)